MKHKLTIITIALCFVLAGVGMAAADSPWDEEPIPPFDPMAVDTYDDITYPTSGGTYYMTENGVDISISVAESPYLPDPVDIYIYNPHGDLIISKHIGPIAGHMVYTTVHIPYGSEEGSYSIRANSMTTDSFLVANAESPSSEIPEFPTMALPIAAIIGIAFLFQRRGKGE